MKIKTDETPPPRTDEKILTSQKPPRASGVRARAASGGPSSKLNYITSLMFMFMSHDMCMHMYMCMWSLVGANLSPERPEGELHRLCYAHTHKGLGAPPLR